MYIHAGVLLCSGHILLNYFFFIICLVRLVADIRSYKKYIIHYYHRVVRIVL